MYLHYNTVTEIAKPTGRDGLFTATTNALFLFSHGTHGTN